MLTSRIDGDERLFRQLQALSLPNNRKRQFNSKLAREVMRQSKARIRQQRDVKGNRFSPRKRGRKKMLTRLMRRASIVRSNSDGASIGWRNNQVGKVARAQQDGHSETMTAEKMKRRRGEPDYDAPATKEQAKALVESGYKRVTGKYRSGKKSGQTKTKRVSQKWITENMTIGHAGLVLRIIRGQDSKKTWQISNPARQFLGADGEDVRVLADMLLDEFIEQIKRV